MRAGGIAKRFALSHLVMVVARGATARSRQQPGPWGVGTPATVHQTVVGHNPPPTSQLSLQGHPVTHPGTGIQGQTAWYHELYFSRGVGGLCVGPVGLGGYRLRAAPLARLHVAGNDLLFKVRVVFHHLVPCVSGVLGGVECWRGVGTDVDGAAASRGDPAPPLIVLGRHHQHTKANADSCPLLVPWIRCLKMFRGTGSHDVI